MERVPACYDSILACLVLKKEAANKWLIRSTKVVWDIYNHFTKQVKRAMPSSADVKVLPFVFLDIFSSDYWIKAFKTIKVIFLHDNIM